MQGSMQLIELIIQLLALLFVNLEYLYFILVANHKIFIEFTFSVLFIIIIMIRKNKNQLNETIIYSLQKMYLNFIN